MVYKELAEPFSHIFRDVAEATWAFDWLRETATRLGIRGAADQRFALTLTRRGGKPGLHLSFGPWLVLGFQGRERVELPLLTDRVAWDERLAELPSEPKESRPDIRSYHLPRSLVRPLSSDLQAASEETLARIAEKFRHWQRATPWKQHRTELIESLFDPDKRAELFAGGLTEPDMLYERQLTAFYDVNEVGTGYYESKEADEDVTNLGDEFIPEDQHPRSLTVNLSQDKVDQMLSLVKQRFPEWSGFSDPDFIEDETGYKQATITLARELLDEAALKRLIDEQNFDDIIDRLEKVGQDNNLLWRSVPASGDLGILYQALDKPAFCQALFDLLYGPDNSPARLERYSNYLQAHNLPNKWTFPTYFLFICHPETDMFVKPSVTQWLLKFLDLDIYTSTPAGDVYAIILEIAAQLKDRLQAYGPTDMVDIQSFIWVCRSVSQQQAGKNDNDDERDEQENEILAPPFSQIFTDRAEAEWAFGFLKETCQRLGIEGPDDLRFAITFSEKKRLRLNFGNWAILSFYNANYRSNRIHINLFVEQVEATKHLYEKWGSFSQAKGEPEISGYNLPIEQVRHLDGDLLTNFEQTLDYTATRFQNWKKCIWRKHNVPEIAEAIFDPSQLAELLDNGLIIEEAAPDDFKENLDGHFNQKTFALLADLHTNPTKDLYLAQKEAFKTHVEEPLQQLFQAVAGRLPPPIIAAMETEKKIFGRILKNDYGQGGAWDFYWGAFYRRGGKRTEDAQLLIWINSQGLEYGFYIGVYGSDERKRFLRNVNREAQAVRPLLRSDLSDPTIVYGSREDYEAGVPSPAFETWLDSSGETDIRATFILGKDEVLRLSLDTLAEKIAADFARLFPLVLLAIKDDPLPAISHYLGLVEEEEIDRQPPYPLPDLAAETGFEEADLGRWVRAIERKGQAILYGPPGTGKTYLAEHLARHLIGGGDGFKELVQFHPAYAYEDFMQGIRPESEGAQLSYPMKPGRFLDFCRRAEGRETCVLIIDEINRANLARVFGELMYLLEYRAQTIRLAGDGAPFTIPANVRLIGTMNTADRSIALVDHALRRRFAFIRLWPTYDLLRRFHEQHDTSFPVEGLIGVLQTLNQRIEENYQIGITFFLHENLGVEIEDIWRMEIEPYLEEYFFGQPEVVAEFRWARVKGEIGP